MPNYIKKEQTCAIQMLSDGTLTTSQGTQTFNTGDYLVTTLNQQYIVEKDVFEQEYELECEETQNEWEKAYEEAYEEAYQDEDYMKAIQEML